MSELSARNFGLVIAYFIPGFVALAGLAEACEPIRLWLVGGSDAGPTIGGFACVAAASLALGMTASAFRWATIDQLHHSTGVERPKLDFSRLTDCLEAFYALVENHYRYYQFYSNMVIATAFSFLTAIWGGRQMPAWAFAVVLVIEAIFVAGSRDALQNYYERSSSLLGVQKGANSHDERIPRRRACRDAETEEAASGQKDAGGSVEPTQAPAKVVYPETVEPVPGKPD